MVEGDWLGLDERTLGVSYIAKIRGLGVRVGDDDGAWGMGDVSEADTELSVGLAEEAWEAVSSQQSSLIYLSIDFAHIWLWLPYGVQLPFWREGTCLSCFLASSLTQIQGRVVDKPDKEVTASPGVSNNTLRNWNGPFLPRARPEMSEPGFPDSPIMQSLSILSSSSCFAKLLYAAYSFSAHST